MDPPSCPADFCCHENGTNRRMHSIADIYFHLVFIRAEKLSDLTHKLWLIISAFDSSVRQITDLDVFMLFVVMINCSASRESVDLFCSSDILSLWIKKIPLENSLSYNQNEWYEIKKKCAQLFRRTQYLKIRPKLYNQIFLSWIWHIGK